MRVCCGLESRHEHTHAMSNFAPNDAEEFVALVLEGLGPQRNERDLARVLQNVYHFLVATQPNAHHLLSMYGVDARGRSSGVFPPHGLGYFWENVMEGLRFKSDLSYRGQVFKKSNSSHFYKYRPLALEMLREQLSYMRRSKAASAATAALPPCHNLSLSDLHSNRRPLGRAFIYVVASGGHSPGGDGGPMLLLLNHRQGGSYGVPGGLEDPCDAQCLQTTALREFVEEFLGMDMKVDKEKRSAACEMVEMGYMSRLSKSSNGAQETFLLVVPDANDFEDRASKHNNKISKDKSDGHKRTGGLSLEMDGYAWFRLSDIKAAIDNPTVDLAGQLIVPDRSGARLVTREHTIGSFNFHGCHEWRQAESIKRILEMFQPLDQPRP